MVERRPTSVVCVNERSSHLCVQTARGATVRPARAKSVGPRIVTATSRHWSADRVPGPRVARDVPVTFGNWMREAVADRRPPPLLGTLKPGSLRWMTRNLTEGEMQEWADMAAEVLADPVYNDRVEWCEYEKRLHKEGAEAAIAYARSKGWVDMTDTFAWSGVKVELLGTSLTMPIPRTGSASSSGSHSGGMTSGAGAGAGGARQQVAGSQAMRTGGLSSSPYSPQSSAGSGAARASAGARVRRRGHTYGMTAAEREQEERRLERRQRRAERALQQEQQQQQHNQPGEEFRDLTGDTGSEADEGDDGIGVSELLSRDWLLDQVTKQEEALDPRSAVKGSEGEGKRGRKKKANSSEGSDAEAHVLAKKGNAKLR